MLHAGVTGAEDHEEVGLAPLGQLAIGPRVRGTAAVEVDVGRDHPRAPRAGRRRASSIGPGPSGGVKNPSIIARSSPASPA